jgi:hypothetical protein
MGNVTISSFSWSALLGWPAMIAATASIVMAVLNRSRAIAILGCLLAAPMCYYLYGTPLLSWCAMAAFAGLFVMAWQIHNMSRTTAALLTMPTGILMVSVAILSLSNRYGARELVMNDVTVPVNIMLLTGSVLSGIAALLHIGIILGGAEWYRFFGAGERFASAAEAGRSYPAVVTTSIATMLAICAVYALSGAGVLPRLPWLLPMLCVITAGYLLRGLLIVPLLTVPSVRATPFLIWSSLICLVYGAVHLLGLLQIWQSH